MIQSKKYLIALAITIAPFLLQAQEEAVKAPFINTHFNGIMKFMFITALLVFLFVFYHLGKALVYFMAKETLGEEKAASYALFPSINFKWNKVSNVLTDAVAIEHEEDILLDHEYDGIRELDNHMPPWWKWMFYISIVWAVVYFSYYIIWGIGANQYEKYDKSVALAEIQKAEFLANMANNVDENTVVQLTDANAIANGKSLFVEKCATCHGELGEGKIGPNLTDVYWIHGGDIKDVFKTVKYGIPNKMIAWGDQLLPSEMSEIASYVLSIQGSNPPNALEPQGELYESAKATSDSTNIES